MCDSPRMGCAWRTTPICMCHKQAIIQWLRRMISIVACWHSVKFCTYAAQAFRSQQNGAVTRMWRSCQVQPSQKEHAIGAVHCENEGMLLQPLRWRYVECVIHHEWDLYEEQHPYVVRASNNRVIAAHDLNCCLLPQCETLHTCHSGIPITTGQTSIASWRLISFSIFKSCS